MGDDTGTRRWPAIALVIAVCLVAANMRPTITAIGPLLDEIGADTGLATGVLGLIAAVPLVAWALVSPLAHDLSRRFGLSRVVLWALVLLTVGTLVRSLPGPSISLWIGTALLGIALAITNVLMPAVVKRDFPARVPVMMSVYTALLGGFGAIASGVAVPVAHLGDPPAGWRVGLLVTGGALLPIAIVVWAWAMRGRDAAHARPRTSGRRVPTGVWTDSVAWLVAAYMGLQSATFYMLVTWLATISTSIGRTPAQAGAEVMFYQLFSIAGSLIVPFVLRGRAERWVPAAIPFVGIVGGVGLMLAPEGLLVWALLLGLFGGASLGMALTLVSQRSRDHDTAAALSGMAQSVGYLVAALGPVAFGALHAATGGWTASLVLLVAVMVVLVGVGVFAGRDRFVLERR